MTPFGSGLIERGDLIVVQEHAVARDHGALVASARTVTRVQSAALDAERRDTKPLTVR